MGGGSSKNKTINDIRAWRARIRVLQQEMVAQDAMVPVLQYLTMEELNETCNASR